MLLETFEVKPIQVQGQTLVLSLCRTKHVFANQPSCVSPNQVNFSFHAVKSIPNQKALFLICRPFKGILFKSKSTLPT